MSSGHRDHRNVDDFARGVATGDIGIYPSKSAQVNFYGVK